MKGKGLTLDARGSRDPDGDELTYEWFVYPPSSEAVRIEAEGPVARVLLPAGVKRTHVVLAVRDSGNPRLTRYSRADLVLP